MLSQQKLFAVAFLSGQGLKLFELASYLFIYPSITKILIVSLCTSIPKSGTS